MRRAERELRDLEVTAPVVLVLGIRTGGRFRPASRECASPCSADSLNVAMAATVALYEVAHRMPPPMA